MIELTDEQVFAIYEMERWYNSGTKQILEISGAAGTGKTTLVRYLIERLGLEYDEVLFVAFMGKAASQLARHGLPAQTIHSAIYNYVMVKDYDEDGTPIFTSSGNFKMKGVFELKDHLRKRIKLIVLDEAAMVDKKLGEDLLSFGLPLIALGDMNQLPPIFGDSAFLQKPDITLKQIMRQAEGDPIIYLSQQILDNKKLVPGVYGHSAVIYKKDLTEFHYKHADMILTGTNTLRYNINNFMRETMKRIVRLDYPHIGEKVICKKNDWKYSIETKEGTIYLTNGLTGFVEFVDRESFNGRTMKMDFRPDFTNKPFKNIKFDYKHMYANPEDEEPFEMYLDKMEYAYAITVHSSQGSQWNNVLYLAENFMRSTEDRKRFNYTAITRAAESIIIVLDS